MANRRTRRGAPKYFASWMVEAGMNSLKQKGFESRRWEQNSLNRTASRGRNSRGEFLNRADKNAIRTLARHAGQSQRTNNYDYTQPSNYSHDARYRNIRRAFGMSAG